MINLLLAVLLCGSERRDIKTLADHPILPAVIQLSVQGLRSLRPPTSLKTRSFYEKQVVEVKASIVGYKLEADQDYHIVIQDETGHTMIVESVDPKCAPSTWAETLFSNARYQLKFLLPYPPVAHYRKLHQPIPVVISGFVFFDKIHGQTGVAPNGVELHPVISIQRAR